MKKYSYGLYSQFLFIILVLNNLVYAQEKKPIEPPKFEITLGAGYGFQYFNSLQQSSSSGTLVPLHKYSTSKPLALRFQIDYNINPLKKVRILLSPFNETGVFKPSEMIDIEGKKFKAEEEIKTRFGFNVLRIGFSNKKEEGKFKNFKIGGTLVIRKWQASFKSASLNTANDNLLAVPLLFLGYEKFIRPKLFFNAEFDGLIVPFASVVEGGASLNFIITKNISTGLQYRILAGTYNSSDVKNKFSTQSIGFNTGIKF
jgi:hypothetical protein